MRAGLVILLAVALVAPAAAAEPRASLPDIEDEVMCVQCGTALNVSESTVAERQREFIRRRIAEGRTKQEIKRDLVREYGPAVLATPADEGFALTAWLVPGLLVLLALAGLAVAVRRWRRAPGTDAPQSAAPALGAEDARRLDAELTAWDRR